MKTFVTMTLFTSLALVGSGCAAQKANPAQPHRYQVVATALTWREAAAYARDRGGHLVYIDSAEENDEVFEQVRAAIAPGEFDRTRSPDGGGAAYVWIGASDLEQEGRWVWGDGRVFWQGKRADQGGRPVGGLYNRWGHEPDDFENRQDAAAMALEAWPRGSGRLGQAGQWNDLDPEDRLYFVIEFEAAAEEQTVTFAETPLALKNPLKGFVSGRWSRNPFVALTKAYVPWRSIEAGPADGVEKVRAYSEERLYQGHDAGGAYRLEERNKKAMPRILLKRSDAADSSYFPDGLTLADHDDQTANYHRRIESLVRKAAAAWDEDPRIGFVAMGIHGTWGEQLAPQMTPDTVRVLGDAFSRYFTHKKVLVRLPHYFSRAYLEARNHRFSDYSYDRYYDFGMYWDAFVWKHEMAPGWLETDTMLELTQLWRENPLLAELAMDAGIDTDDYATFNDCPDGLNHEEKTRCAAGLNLTNPDYLDYIMDGVRTFHATGISWLADYDPEDPEAATGAEEVQKALGYRFVLERATLPRRIEPGVAFTVKFTVRNTGSAPFYYRWPVALGLLDLNDKEPVWQGVFENTDLRSWMPGDDWDAAGNRYTVPAADYTEEGEFRLPADVPSGPYVLALAVLDPAGMRPSLRFAVRRYYAGGWTPLAVVGVGEDARAALPPGEITRDDPALGYARP